MGKIFEHIGIDEYEFDKAYNFYMNHPLTKQELIDIEMSCNAEKNLPIITREKCKEVFLDHEEKKFEKTKQIILSQKSQEEMINELMVMEPILYDEMFDQHGIEQENLIAAIAHYKLMDDPEVYKKIHQI